MAKPHEYRRAEALLESIPFNHHLDEGVYTRQQKRADDRMFRKALRSLRKQSAMENRTPGGAVEVR